MNAYSIRRYFPLQFSTTGRPGTQYITLSSVIQPNRARAAQIILPSARSSETQQPDLKAQRRRAGKGHTYRIEASKNPATDFDIKSRLRRSSSIETFLPYRSRLRRLSNGTQFSEAFSTRVRPALVDSVGGSERPGQRQHGFSPRDAAEAPLPRVPISRFADCPSYEQGKLHT